MTGVITHVDGRRILVDVDGEAEPIQVDVESCQMAWATLKPGDKVVFDRPRWAINVRRA